MYSRQQKAYYSLGNPSQNKLGQEINLIREDFTILSLDLYFTVLNPRGPYQFDRLYGS